MQVRASRATGRPCTPGETENPAKRLPWPVALTSSSMPRPAPPVCQAAYGHVFSVPVMRMHYMHELGERCMRDNSRVRQPARRSVRRSPRAASLTRGVPREKRKLQQHAPTGDHRAEILQSCKRKRAGHTRSPGARADRRERLRHRHTRRRPRSVACAGASLSPASMWRQPASGQSKETRQSHGTNRRSLQQNRIGTRALTPPELSPRRKILHPKRW